MKGNLFVVSGPSGAGKGTICKAYVEKHPEVYLSISATTRKPRAEDADGVTYFFIDEDQFRAGIAKDAFLEHAVYCDNYYGTPKEPVMKQLEAGRDVILEIESDGAMQVRSHFPEGVFIFVCPPSIEELNRRLEGRGSETPEEIQARLEKAKSEFPRAKKYNYMLMNDDVDAAVQRLEAIIAAEKCYMPRNIEFINKEFLK